MKIIFIYYFQKCPKILCNWDKSGLDFDTNPRNMGSRHQVDLCNKYISLINMNFYIDTQQEIFL